MYVVCTKGKYSERMKRSEDKEKPHELKVQGKKEEERERKRRREPLMTSQSFFSPKFHVFFSWPLPFAPWFSSSSHRHVP